ncbi:TetR family transcriptional regulator [Pseudonocardia sp. ICBG1293]|jgi:TetR/AcrR family tetracycline transcriptional repressor|uniref:TetR family transcriptional regulator n=1 Tax=Pseudonocardia sp. ICBG1293 TaxID=2844382 RepID=UPI001CCCB3CC|nr:TetR family transcriptional regulator [Pseudonocardia sp. ICBG1293]
MPRPASPLIRYDSVISTSLEIIDAEGLEAFSLPRLARALNVRAPSLYHHFADKAEILRGVARAIVVETRMPDSRTTPNWVEWFVALSLNFRHAVLQHRNAAPVLLRFMPRDVLIRTYEQSARFLTAVGVPADQCVLLLDGLDKLTLGAAIAEAAKDPAEAGELFGTADPESEPTLANAVAQNRMSTEEVFAETVRSFLRGAAPYVPADAPPPDGLAGRTVADLRPSEAS